MKSIVKTLAKSEVLASLIFSILLLGVRVLLGLTAMRFPFFKNRLKEKNLTVQIKLKDNSRGRYYILKDGVVSSGTGIHPSPDVTIFFANARIALDMLVPPRDQLAMVNAMKTFQMGMIGPDELTYWWMETLSLHGQPPHQVWNENGQRCHEVYQQYQRRACLCLCERRQDHTHHTY